MTSPMLLGIDPGTSGGVAFIYTHKGVWHVAHAGKCPETIQDMVTILRCHGGVNPQAVLERVHSMPGQGVVSVFTFGRNYGRWEGALTACSIPYVDITPAVWMKHFGAMPKERKARKNHLKHLAQQRFPDVKVTLYNADALLMAVYGLEVSWRVG